MLYPILSGQSPVQWQHYPADDAIDREHRYQWFYHSHSPADRPSSIEHGHFHLFARMEGTSTLIDADHERDFLKVMGTPDSSATTRHLLCIGMSSVGVPISIFTVNRWVTGDLLLSGRGTTALLESIMMDTGHSEIDTLLIALIRLYRRDVRILMRKRDAVLATRSECGPGAFDDVNLEVLSTLTLNLDDRIAQAIA
ncbi:MAG: hypothetical protein AB7F79_12820 [Steroidobacteraceae bacterium]